MCHLSLAIAARVSRGSQPQSGLADATLFLVCAGGFWVSPDDAMWKMMPDLVTLAVATVITARGRGCASGFVAAATTTSSWSFEDPNAAQ